MVVGFPSIWTYTHCMNYGLQPSKHSVFPECTVYTFIIIRLDYLRKSHPIRKEPFSILSRIIDLVLSIAL